jgi:hypothetical protein
VSDSENKTRGTEECVEEMELGYKPCHEKQMEQLKMISNHIEDVDSKRQTVRD